MLIFGAKIEISLICNEDSSLRSQYHKCDFLSDFLTLCCIWKAITLNIILVFAVEELNRYLLLIFQFVLSMVSAFAFGYLAPYYFYGTVDVGRRLLYGIISGFVVGMADLYFVIRHLLTTEGVIQIKEKES